MSKIQVIEKDDVPAFVVLPIELLARVRELVEDAEAIAALERFDRESDGTRVPIEVVRATLQEGRHSGHAAGDRLCLECLGRHARAEVQRAMNGRPSAMMETRCLPTCR